MSTTRRQVAAPPERNVEALRRLGELAEGKKPEPTTSRSGPNAGGGEGGPAVGPEGWR